jgi:energy-coupling factor transporter ATP-binding protein EcfA2
MVFQNSDDRLFISTAYENMAFELLNLGLPLDEVHVRVEKALETVGVEDLKNRQPCRLSSGQKRRVAIATDLSMSPGILVVATPPQALFPEHGVILSSCLKRSSTQR